MKLKSFSPLNAKNASAFIYRFYTKFPKWQYLNTKKLRDFSRIIKEFHSDFIETVCEERYGAELPLRLGRINIAAYRSTTDYSNYRLYEDTGVKTFFNNNDTDGFKCRVVYSNASLRYRVKDRSLWEFSTETIFRKKVSKAFRTEYNKYLISPIKSNGNNFDWKLKVKEDLDKKISDFLVNYDEFSMN